MKKKALTPQQWSAVGNRARWKNKTPEERKAAVAKANEGRRRQAAALKEAGEKK
jgi:hypothetical protein